MKAAVSTTVYDAENRRKERTAGATIREARRENKAMCNQVVMVVSNHHQTYESKLGILPETGSEH